MSETTCRWDRDAEGYLSDGRPCRTDNYGDPTKHCTARRTCSNHIGKGEHTCARCLGRARIDIKKIADLAPLMLTVALDAGVNSEAAMLAGPAANVHDWSERRIAMRSHLATWHERGKITEPQYLHARATMEDDDEWHPYTVLTRWEFMLREDYDQPRTAPTSITQAAAYLDRILHRVAQDEEQDFPLLAREMRKCRNHLETVMADSRQPERGAPCKTCHEERPNQPAPRLTRRYGHWCEDETCERMHYADDSADEWKCPRDRGHTWTEAEYRKWADDRQKVPQRARC